MKNLLLLCALALAFTSCKKAILKPTSVRIVADDATVSIDFPNDGEKHLAGLSDEQIKDIYLEQLRNSLNSGKLNVVESGADYTIIVKHIDVAETVEAKYEDGEWFNISRIDTRAVFNVNQVKEDLPQELIIEDHAEESLEEDKKGKGSKSKGGKSWNNDDYYISGFGGLEGAFGNHTGEARSEIKKIIRSKQ